MEQEEKNQYPWLTVLKDERDKVVRNHQNRVIHFENAMLETLFSCGLMLIGAGFLAAGIIGYFGTIEIGQMAGLLLGVLLLYAGFLFILAYDYDYGTLSALETILSTAKTKRDITAAWLKEAIQAEMAVTRKPVFSSGILANFLGLFLVIYGVYVADLLLLKRLGTSPLSMMSGLIIVLISSIGGLSFFLIKEPYKRSRISGFKYALEIIRSAESTPKPKDIEDEETFQGETVYSGPDIHPGDKPAEEPPLNGKAAEEIELHNLDPDDLDEIENK
jgi:hypothetical protein